MPTRRVVTGLGADGKGHFVSDGPPPCVLAPDDLPGLETAYVWATHALPPVPNAGADQTRMDQVLFPGPEGSRFLVITFPPGFGAAPPDAGVETELEAMTAPVSFDRVLMHATTTIDYGVVLKGEVTLILDSGEEVTLRATDTVIQNGTVHGWRNSSDEAAIVAFVVLGAQATGAPSPRDTVKEAVR